MQFKKVTDFYSSLLFTTRIPSQEKYTRCYLHLVFPSSLWSLIQASLNWVNLVGEISSANSDSTNFRQAVKQSSFDINLFLSKCSVGGDDILYFQRSYIKVSVQYFTEQVFLNPYEGDKKTEDQEDNG